MARLRGRIKMATADRPTIVVERLGQQMAEGQVSSFDEKARKDVTVATARIFEDGSGIFQFRRGFENITIRWTEENTPVFELHADFNGVAGTLIPEQIAVSEESDGN